MASKLRSHSELDVYKRSVEIAMAVYEHSKSFPREEVFSLTDQIRRSSRSVSANIAEAWRKRRYPASFVSKINDAEAEAAESQVWIEYAVKCRYLTRTTGASLYRDCDRLIATLVGMVRHHEKWTFPRTPTARS